MNKEEIDNAVIVTVKEDIKRYWEFVESKYSERNLILLYGMIVGLNSYFIMADCEEGKELIDNFKAEVNEK